MKPHRVSRTVVPVVVAFACAACALPPEQPTAAADPKPEPSYRTGSRIPVRDPASADSKAISGQTAQDELMRGSPAGRPPGK